MDLTQLSKDTLISIIKDLHGQIHNLQGQLHNLEKQTIQNPIQNPKQNTFNMIYDIDNHSFITIEDHKSVDFGSGKLRYKKGEKYYHGIGPNEIKYKWYRTGKYDKLGQIFEYRNLSKVMNHPDKWDFHKGTTFCNHCICDEDNKRRGFILFRCLGHTIE